MRPPEKRGGYQPLADGAPPTVAPPKRADAAAAATPPAFRTPLRRCPPREMGQR